LKQLDKKLYVSSDIRTDEARDFLQTTAGLGNISNAMTALIAPQQHDAGLAAIQCINAGMHIHAAHPNQNFWISVWYGFALIVNRITLCIECL